ncbi:uncharacterized protein [Panulirus ornatus]|uniref:uncharacterized protein n=1 Tax=Panulirus ornatus TaxID=150431 RepID=UPI003A84D45C
MKKLMVLMIMVLTEAAESQFHHQVSPLYTSDQGPPDPHVLEEQVLEEELAHLEEMSRPSLYNNKGEHWPREATHDKYPKKYHRVKPPASHPVGPAPEPHPGEGTEKIRHTTTRKESSSVEETSQHSWEDVPSQSQPEQTRYVTESSFDVTTTPHAGTGLAEEGEEVEPTVGTECNPGVEVMQEPVVLPVTEGKNDGRDSGAHYGLPKELMPIHPGGGSRFEDLEKEKLERAKMAQTKAQDGDTENGTSHDAESLYSSSTTLCLSSLIISFSSLRILI